MKLTQQLKYLSKYVFAESFRSPDSVYKFPIRLFSLTVT